MIPVIITMKIIIMTFFSLSGFSEAWLLRQLRRLRIKLKSQQSNTILVFDKRGKPEYKGNTSQSRVENQQTQSTYNDGAGNQTQAMLVKAECTNPAL